MFWHTSDKNAELQRLQILLTEYQGCERLVESLLTQCLPEKAPDLIGLS